MDDEEIIKIYMVLCVEFYPFFFVCFQLLNLIYKILNHSGKKVCKVGIYLYNKEYILSSHFEKIKNNFKPFNITTRFKNLLNGFYKTNETKKDDNKNEDKIDIFIKKYNSLYTEDKCLKNNTSLKNCYLFCSTPLGNVIIIYNDNFNYYSDFSIPHRCLDVLGKKYVSVFGCGDLYDWNNSEDKEEVDKEEVDKEEEKEEKDEKNEDVSKKNLYLKFKNNVVLTNKSHNKFKYVGKLSDFIFLQQSNNNKSNKKNVNYEDFKKNFKKNN